MQASEQPTTITPWFVKLMFSGTGAYFLWIDFTEKCD